MYLEALTMQPGGTAKVLVDWLGRPGSRPASLHKLRFGDFHHIRLVWLLQIVAGQGWWHIAILERDWTYGYVAAEMNGFSPA